MNALSLITCLLRCQQSEAELERWTTNWEDRGENDLSCLLVYQIVAILHNVSVKCEICLDFYRSMWRGARNRSRSTTSTTVRTTNPDKPEISDDGLKLSHNLLQQIKWKKLEGHGYSCIPEVIAHNGESMIQVCIPSLRFQKKPSTKHQLVTIWNLCFGPSK